MSAKDYSTHMAIVAFVHNRSSSNNSEKFLAAKIHFCIESVNSSSSSSQGKFPVCVSESLRPTTTPAKGCDNIPATYDTASYGRLIAKLRPPQYYIPVGGTTAAFARGSVVVIHSEEAVFQPQFHTLSCTNHGRHYQSWIQ